MCVVFAETEIIGLLSSGVPPADIVAGVQAAKIDRKRQIAEIAVRSGSKLTSADLLKVIFSCGLAAEQLRWAGLVSQLRCELDRKFTTEAEAPGFLGDGFQHRILQALF